MLQAGLGAAMDDVRAIGYAIGLHTAGMYPEILSRVLPKLDWIGLDIKAPLDCRYTAVTGVPDAPMRVYQAAMLVAGSGVAYELRTTENPAHFDNAARTALIDQLEALNLPATHWQKYRNPTVG